MSQPCAVPLELMFAVMENPNLTADEAVALSGGSISKKRAEKWLKGCAESKKQTDKATKTYKGRHHETRCRYRETHRRPFLQDCQYLVGIRVMPVMG
jgi:hypothetical protein